MQKLYNSYAIFMHFWPFFLVFFSFMQFLYNFYAILVRPNFLYNFHALLIQFRFFGLFLAFYRFCAIFVQNLYIFYAIFMHFWPFFLFFLVFMQFSCNFHALLAEYFDGKIYTIWFKWGPRLARTRDSSRDFTKKTLNPHRRLKERNIWHLFLPYWKASKRRKNNNKQRNQKNKTKAKREKWWQAEEKKEEKVIKEGEWKKRRRILPVIKRSFSFSVYHHFSSDFRSCTLIFPFVLLLLLLLFLLLSFFYHHSCFHFYSFYHYYSPFSTLFISLFATFIMIEGGKTGG